jgi:hypothetical protein
MVAHSALYLVAHVGKVTLGHLEVHWASDQV